MTCHPAIPKVSLPGDYSYGVYVYGFRCSKPSFGCGRKSRGRRAHGDVRSGTHRRLVVVALDRGAVAAPQAAGVSDTRGVFADRRCATPRPIARWCVLPGSDGARASAISYAAWDGGPIPFEHCSTTLSAGLAHIRVRQDLQNSNSIVQLPGEHALFHQWREGKGGGDGAAQATGLKLLAQSEAAAEPLVELELLARELFGLRWRSNRGNTAK